MNFLDRYGFEAMGIYGNTELNKKMIKAIKSHYDNQEIGAIALNSVIDELYKKAEAIENGRSSGFRMFTTICKEKTAYDNLMRDVFDILRDAGWKYNLLLTDDSLISA